jgi:hypothetical protein
MRDRGGKVVEWPELVPRVPAADILEWIYTLRSR